MGVVVVPTAEEVAGALQSQHLQTGLQVQVPPALQSQQVHPFPEEEQLHLLAVVAVVLVDGAEVPGSRRDDDESQLHVGPH